MGQVSRYDADKIHHLGTGGAEEAKMYHLSLCFHAAHKVSSNVKD